MDYNFLMQKNKEYEVLKRKCERILKENTENINNINNLVVESLDLEFLNIDELDLLIKIVSGNIDYKLMNKLKRTYERKIKNEEDKFLRVLF